MIFCGSLPADVFCPCVFSVCLWDDVTDDVPDVQMMLISDCLCGRRPAEGKGSGRTPETGIFILPDEGNESGRRPTEGKSSGRTPETGIFILPDEENVSGRRPTEGKGSGRTPKTGIFILPDEENESGRRPAEGKGSDRTTRTIIFYFLCRKTKKCVVPDK